MPNGARGNGTLGLLSADVLVFVPSDYKSRRGAADSASYGRTACPARLRPAAVAVVQGLKQNHLFCFFRVKRPFLFNK